MDRSTGHPTWLFEAGNKSYSLDDVTCSGDEQRLIDCPHDPTPNCKIGLEDAGVRCLYRAPPTYVNGSGAVRLIDGSGSNNGRVEVFLNGSWSAICKEYWSIADARVVCRQLGFNITDHSVATIENTVFGELRTPANKFLCEGNESSLIECSHTLDGTERCYHAGVACLPIITDLPEGSVRLVGSSSMSGRLEVLVNNVWGTVCDERFTRKSGETVCRLLNFTDTGARVGRTAGTGPIWLTDVDCIGNESSIFNCSLSFSTSSCFHNQDVSIECYKYNVCREGDIRLVNGTSPSEGRVEMCYRDAWSSICHTFWDSRGARQVCRQLNLPFTAAIPFKNAYFGEGSGRIYYDQIRCSDPNGRTIVDDCRFTTRPRSSCSHRRDAGVRCASAAEIISSDTVRLVGGRIPLEGRVEVLLDGVWGTICANRYWNASAATTVCRQLGFPTNGSIALSGSAFGPGAANQPIHMNGLFCSGDEPGPQACIFTQGGYSSCGHSNDASVICQPPPVPTMPKKFEVQLNTSECNMAVFTWTNYENLQYSKLYYYIIKVISLNSKTSIETRVPINRTSHTIILECGDRYLSFITAYALNVPGLDSDVIIFKTGLARCTNGDVRLVGGTTPFNGVVEMCYNETYGTICDSGFGVPEATVVCSGLGYSRMGASVPSKQIFGVGSDIVLLTGLQCTGNETSLLMCPYMGTIGSNCTHSSYARVQCLRKPTEPTNVTALANDDASINVTWQVPQEYDSELTGYRIVCTSPYGYSGLQNGSITLQTATITGLLAYTLYNCCVEARYTNVRQNAQSCAIAKTTEGLPEAPRYLRVQYVTDVCNEVFFQWSPPTRINGRRRSYRVTVIDHINSTIILQDTTMATSLRRNGLLCCANYSFAVEAQTSSGYGPSSPLLAFSTQPDPQASGVAPVIDVSSRMNNGDTIAVEINDRIDIEFYVVKIYNSSGNFLLDRVVGPVQSTQTTARNVEIGNLVPCQVYWVTTRATSCGLQLESDPVEAGLGEVVEFSAEITLGNLGPCTTWIKNNIETKRSSINNFVLATLKGDCNHQVSCLVNISFECNSPDKNTADFLVYLATTNEASGANQKQCLNDFFSGRSDGSRAIEMNGNMFPIAVNPATEVTQAITTDSGVGGWVWSIVATIVAGLFILLLIGIIIVVKKKSDPKCNRRHFHERMLDDQDNVHSTYSVGVMENPLYGEHEDYGNSKANNADTIKNDTDEKFNEDHVDRPHEDNL